MKLHVLPFSPNSHKVLMVNEIAGTGAAVVPVDVSTGAHKSPDFLALNPNGRLPVLEFDDGSTLWESNAIINRLAGMAKSNLWPASDMRYDILRWQFWEACHMNPACVPYASKYVFGQEGVDLEAAAETFHTFAKVLDDHLAGRDWLVGDSMTTADISVAMVLGLREACHYPISGYANVLGWLGRIEALPAAALRAPLPSAAE